MAREPDQQDQSTQAYLAGLRVAGLYLLIASLWILFSDQLLAQLAGSQAALVQLQTVKGLGFVLLTAVALFGLVRHAVGLALRSADLEKQLRYDTLTGLPNRALLASMMHPALKMARQRAAGMAVVAVHVDGLQQINESLGVTIGDQVLVEVSQRLRTLMRPGDLLARATGNTFIAAVDDPMDMERVRDIARAVLRSVAEPIALAAAELRISASVGISRFPDDATEPDTLLSAAEAALAKARTETGWRVRLYSSGLARATSARFHLENELRKAIDGQQLALHFQPQVRLSDGQPIGVEALLRWEHPDLGIVPPSRFVPLAEQTGLIMPLSEWLLHEAFRHARGWLDDGLPPLRLAINLSGQQFSYRRLNRHLEDLLDRHRLRASLVELEITEYVAMRDPQRSMQVLKELRDIGFSIAIDDFGTGHSSLAYLQSLPVDRVKIDGSFLAGIPGNARNEAICRTIIRLGHDLGLGTLAECIESPPQREVLLAAGCDEGQGFLFARPMTPEHLREWISRQAATGG